MVRSVSDYNWNPTKPSDYTDYLISPVGDSYWERLMAGPNEVSTETDDNENQYDSIVRDAVASLGDQDRFIIEQIHTWGKSYSELSDMLGYSSKSTIHKLVHKAQDNLKKILLQQPAIRQMLGETDDNLE
jgi:DNA-directed RNA polymerase specialized sigma24 family protein